MKEETLVDGIHIAVAGVTTAFIAKYPALKHILQKSKHPANDWDFFMTIAGVGIHCLKHKVGKDERLRLVRELTTRDKQMPEGLDNLFDYLQTHADPDLDARLLVGFWVLWNIAGEPPSQEESTELAPAIGIYLDRVVTDLAGG